MKHGSSLERADMVARLLMTRSLAGTIGANWTTLLRSCAAHEAYLRRVPALVSEERAALAPRASSPSPSTSLRSPSTTSRPLRRALGSLRWR